MDRFNILDKCVTVAAVSMLCLDTRLGCLDPMLSKDSEAADTISATQGLFQSFQMLYYGLPLWKYYKTAGYKLLQKSETVLYRLVGWQSIYTGWPKIIAPKYEKRYLGHYCSLGLKKNN